MSSGDTPAPKRYPGPRFPLIAKGGNEKRTSKRLVGREEAGWNHEFSNKRKRCAPWYGHGQIVNDCWARKENKGKDHSKKDTGSRERRVEPRTRNLYRRGWLRIENRI